VEVVNDNLDAWVTALSFQVTKDDILSGRMNGKMLNSVVGVFLKQPFVLERDAAAVNAYDKARADFKKANDKAVSNIQRGIPSVLPANPKLPEALMVYEDSQALMADLERRRVSTNKWGMYAVVGHIGFASDFSIAPYLHRAGAGNQDLWRRGKAAFDS